MLSENYVFMNLPFYEWKNNKFEIKEYMYISLFLISEEVENNE